MVKIHSRDGFRLISELNRGGFRPSSVVFWKTVEIFSYVLINWLMKHWLTDELIDFYTVKQDRGWSILC